MEVNPVTAFLLALIPLVVFHELGHFLMAKLGGIHVTKFCIGFGKRLFGFHYKGTDYCWNLLPLGGYVDFMGELVYTGEIPDDVTHFYNKPKWLRFLVLIMGPLFNMILAFGLYWVYHSVEPTRIPIFIGEPYRVGMILDDAPEAAAGLQVGDRIVRFDGKDITDWRSIETQIQLSPGKQVTLQVERDGQVRDLSYTVPAHEVEGYGVQGFYSDMRVEIGKVMEDNPAAVAGIRPGDLLTAVNGVPVTYTTSAKISEEISRTAPGPAQLSLLRDGAPLDLSVVPRKHQEDDGTERWVIGFTYTYEHTLKEADPITAIGMAWDSFKETSTILFSAVRKLVELSLPLKMLSGPVGVAKVAQEALGMGIPQFIWMVALLSLNLGIMNLLPIPVLDGGEIFVLLVEGITRKDFSLDTKMRIKMVGLFVLILLMGFVFISDIFKLF